MSIKSKFVIEKEYITALASSLSLRGLVLEPSSPQYESYRVSWNHSFTAHPPLIAVAACTSDVIKIIKWCRQYNYPMSVTSGRHSRHALSDNAVQLNLEHMRGVNVNLKDLTVTVQGGCRNADIDNEINSYNLGVTLGVVGDTGMGLCLGGGNGFLARKCGFTCDNIIDAQIVTAEGNVVQCSSVENQDLFWGIKGAGFNFGVVTSLTLKVYPVGHIIKKSLSTEDEEAAIKYSIPAQNSIEGKIVTLTKVYPAAAAPIALVKLSEVSHSDQQINRDLFFECELVPSPNGPCLVVFCGSIGVDIYESHRLVEELSDRITAEFPSALPLLMKEFKIIHYSQLQSFIGNMCPAGYWLERSAVFDKISPELASIIHHCYVNKPAAADKSILPCIAWNARGRGQEIDSSSSSFSPRSRTSSFWLVIMTPHDGPNTEVEAQEWQESFKKQLVPYLSSALVNTVYEADNQKDLFSDHLSKLKNLKAVWDPSNFFCFNNNITPAEK